MTGKLEMVRQMGQLEDMRSVMTALQQQTSALRQEMAALPAAVANEVSTALEHLERLEQDACRASEACETIARLQRQTLDILAHDLAQGATEAMAQQTATLAQSVDQMRRAIETMEASARQAAQVPERLDQARRRMVRAADHLAQQAQALSPRPRWQRALATSAIAAIGGATGAAMAVVLLGALSGHVAFGGAQPPKPPSETLAQALPQHATPAMGASPRLIVLRPGPQIRART